MITVRIVRNILDWSRAEELQIEGPAILEDVCPPEVAELACAEAFVDGLPVPREEWVEREVDGSAAVSFVLRPQLSAAALEGLVLFFQVVSVGFLARSLIKGPPSASERGKQSSRTYSFTGLGNSRIEGQPIEMIYGKHRVGGQVLNEYTQSVGIPSTSDLFLLLGFGHGPIFAVGNQEVDIDGIVGAPDTVYVEGNPAENFDDINSWVRLGTAEQTPIPNFHRVYQNFETAFELKGKSTSTESNHGLLYVDTLYPPADPYSKDYDEAWETWGATYDITEASDGAQGLVVFDRGLFATDDGGSINDSYFKLQIRYRELDGGNNPIQTGGPNSDGWVRAVPSATISPNQTERFERAYSVGPFIDPQTWTLPVAGNALEGTGGSGHLASAAISTTNPYYGSDLTASEWGVAVWFYLVDALPQATGSGTEYQICGNQDSGQSRGFSLSFKDRAFGQWQLQAKVSGLFSGSARSVYAETTGGGPTGTGVWRHLAFSYGRLQNGGVDRLRLWIDKVQIATLNSPDDVVNFKPVDATTPRPILCFGSHNYGTNIDGRVDDLVVTENEFGQGFVDNRVDSKAPLDSGNPEYQLRGRWAYDETAPTATAANDVLVDGERWFEDATLTNCDTSATGEVLGPPGGTTKRMKARVEFLRLTYDMNRSDIFDDATLVQVSPWIDEALSYPLTPELALQIRATEQLNTSVPNISVEVKGLLVPWWSGEGPTPSGYAWSASPAWVALDLLTNPEYGLGNRFGFGNMDMDSFLAWHRYCWEVVYDGSFADGPDQGIGWSDIRFDAGTTGPDPDDPTQTITRGSLAFLYASPTDGTPPEHFKVGRFVRPSGVTPVGGGTDINVDDVDVRGYEIVRKPTYTGAAWELLVYWDRLDEADPWTDGDFLQNFQTPDGETTGGQHRFEFNAVLDEERDAWEQILDVCAVGRAIPVKEGKSIRIVYQAPLPASTYAHALLGRGDIIDGSFRIDYVGSADKPLVYEIEYWDEDELYERQIWRALSSELTNASESRAEDMRTESIRLFGVTHRAQAERHANFMHNTNRLVRRVGEFRCGPGALRVEPGDVTLISHDILPRGVSGRASGTGTIRQVITEEAFEIVSGLTYYVYVRDFNTGLVERGTLDQTVTGPGDYPDGGTLHCVDPFATRPQERLTSFVLCEDGAELRVRITETSLEEDLEMLVRWSEYHPDLFDDTATQVETSSEFFGPNAPGGGGVNTPGIGPVGADRPPDNRLPDGPVGLQVSERLASDSGSGRAQRLVLSWTWASGELARIASVRVFARRTPLEREEEGVATTGQAAWSLAGEFDGPRTGATLALPFAVRARESVQVAVQGVTLAGTRRRPDRCPQIAYTIIGADRGPEGLAEGLLTAELDGDLATYGWALPSTQGLQVEIRRGGWILGDVVYSGPADTGTSGPTGNWSGARGGNYDAFPLFFATRDSAGQYGRRARLDFVPTPETGGPFPTDFQRQAWEEYADGWKTDSTSPVGDPQLSNLQRHADGYLEFTAGSATLATYDTWNPQIGAVTQPRALVPHEVFLEASVEAEQVHPLLWEGALWAWGDPRYARWTWEGPAWTARGEPANSALALYWRHTHDGITWEDWAPFKPGQYRVVDFQFRVQIRRPDESYQVKLRRFHTRARLIMPSALQRDRVSSYLEREIF